MAERLFIPLKSVELQLTDFEEILRKIQRSAAVDARCIEYSRACLDDSLRALRGRYREPHPTID